VISLTTTKTIGILCGACTGSHATSAELGACVKATAAADLADVDQADADYAAYLAEAS
jgi:hypothetical protein